MESVSLIKPAEMTANETWHRELLFRVVSGFRSIRVRRPHPFSTR